jgi:hypothetical protein
MRKLFSFRRIFPILFGFIVYSPVVALSSDLNTGGIGNSEISNPEQGKLKKTEELAANYEKLLELTERFKQLVEISGVICPTQRFVLSEYVEAYRDFVITPKVSFDLMSNEEMVSLVQMTTTVDAICRIAKMNVEFLKTHFEYGIKPKFNLYCNTLLKKIKDDWVRNFLDKHYCRRIKKDMNEIEKIIKDFSQEESED